METVTLSLPLADLRIDGGTQSRAGDDQAAIGEYAEAYRKGEPMPPLRVVRESTPAGVLWWLYGGHHRYGGALVAGLTEVSCEVIDGTLADARWLCAAENRTHGIRRTTDDKRKAARLALEQHPEYTDRRIADHVGVDSHTVEGVRKKLEAGQTIPALDRRIDRNGTSRPARQPAKTAGVRNSTDEGVGDNPDSLWNSADAPAEPGVRNSTDGKAGKVAALVDAEGNPVPDRLRDTFADRWLADRIAALKAWHEAHGIADTRSGFRARYAHYPYHDLPLVVKRLEAIDEAFELALECLRAGAPYAVHQACGGEGCADCRHVGWLPQWRWEELKAGGGA